MAISWLPGAPVAEVWAHTAIEDQPALLLAVLRRASPEDFWPIFFEWYPKLAQPWRIKKKLLNLLRGAGDAKPFHSSADSAYLNSLPVYIQVLRGAPSFHRDGLEWVPTYAAAEANARRARATWGSGNVYEGMVASKDIFAVLDTDHGEQTLIVDYLTVPQPRLIRPEDVRSRENFILRPIISADEIRQLELQPAHTDGRSWERYKWQPTPDGMLAAASNATLEAKLCEVEARLAAAHLEREILGLELEKQSIKKEQAWRERNPGKDPRDRFRDGKPKPKGKSPGRPPKDPKK
jgi:hypothetical protein